MTVTLHHGDCLAVMTQLAKAGVKVDSIVTDPPYHLSSIVKRFGGKNAAAAKDRDGLYKRSSAGFMGKQWDGGDIAFRAETWALALDLLKPGGHVLAFSGTRTYHRMATAIEDSGFVIRDMFSWLYGSGFPKSHDISKAIDKAAGEVREVREVRTSVNGFGGSSGIYAPMAATCNVTDPKSEAAKTWQGWGTALKPACEPLCLGQKPVEGTIAGNVLKYGVGALNIDACRIGGDGGTRKEKSDDKCLTSSVGGYLNAGAGVPGLGRWPANVMHDGSDEVLAGFPDAPGQQRATGPQYGDKKSVNVFGDYGPITPHEPRNDSGSAARFFYTAKADAEDRWGSKHPTVKPVDLIRYYCRLITPPGGLVLDPFAGSGTLGVAAIAEGFDAILIEREAEYIADIRERLAFYQGGDRHSMASKNRNRSSEKTPMLAMMEGGK
jgi:site-specific DNA-methyltransferase (adenine-specific)